MKFTFSTVLAAVAAASFRGALAAADEEVHMRLTKTIEWKEGETEASATLPQVKVVNRENARRLQALITEETEEQATRHLRSGGRGGGSGSGSSGGGGGELLLTSFQGENKFALIDGELLSFSPFNDQGSYTPACTSSVCRGALSAIIEGEEGSSDDECLYLRALIPVTASDKERYSLNCPAQAMDAEVKILDCIAGSSNNGADAGTCPMVGTNQLWEMNDTPGFVEVRFRATDRPVTYYAEFSCCPMTFNGLEMDSSSSKSSSKSGGSSSEEE